MKRQILYGMLGFLSLLGFVGVFTEARGFLGFFGFAVDFSISSSSPTRCWQSSCPVCLPGPLWLGCWPWRPRCWGPGPGGFDPSRALLTGCAVGWAASVAVYALTAAWYGFRENWGLEP